MMEEKATDLWKSRTKLLIGEESLGLLDRAHVIIFGIGGVGGYVAEGLARSGVGRFTLVDRDTVGESNINRQIIALNSTVGQYKTEAMAARILDINPGAEVIVRNEFFLPESSGYNFSDYSYVVDAVDTVTAKLDIIMRAKECKVPVISAMGAGNKLEPLGFKVADIYKTDICPLARVMRRECKKRGIDSLKVVYSVEKPLKTGIKDEESGKTIPGSIVFSPAVMGLLISSEIVKDLINGYER